MIRVRRGSKKLWWLLLVLPVLIFAVVFSGAIWWIASGSPGHTDFYWQRARYERIVARARAMPLTPGSQTNTTIEGCRVDIGRNGAGSYTVTITTADRHHAGVYGYVFSDVPLTAHPNANYPDYPEVDNPGDMPFADKRIIGQNGHWWSVYNNLG